MESEITLVRNQTPHIKHPSDGFDRYAFNALAVGGHIAAFHAGNQRIFIYKSDWDIVNGTSTMMVLQDLGWSFFMIDIEKP